MAESVKVAHQNIYGPYPSKPPANSASLIINFQGIIQLPIFHDPRIWYSRVRSREFPKHYHMLLHLTVDEVPLDLRRTVAAHFGPKQYNDIAEISIKFQSQQCMTGEKLKYIKQQIQQ